MQKEAKDNGLMRLKDTFAREKKKGIIAVCLVLIMTFMWVRMFTREGPKKSEASQLTKTASPKSSTKSVEAEIVYVKLPKVDGRNDVITRNVFLIDGKSFGNDQNIDVVIQKDTQLDVKRIADKLILRAIVLGEKKQAFINDELLIMGSKLKVVDGSRKYECEVLRIEKDTVTVSCNGAELKLRLEEADKKNP